MACVELQMGIMEPHSLGEPFSTVNRHHEYHRETSEPYIYSISGHLRIHKRMVRKPFPEVVRDQAVLPD